MGQRYTIDELITISNSPLVSRPSTLPPLEEWMGSPLPTRTTPARGPRTSDDLTQEEGQRGRRPSLFSHMSRGSTNEDIVFGPPKLTFASASAHAKKNFPESDFLEKPPTHSYNPSNDEDKESPRYDKFQMNRFTYKDKERYTNDASKPRRNREDADGWTSVQRPPRKSFTNEDAERDRDRFRRDRNDRDHPPRDRNQRYEGFGRGDKDRNDTRDSHFKERDRDQPRRVNRRDESSWFLSDEARAARNAEREREYRENRADYQREREREREFRRDRNDRNDNRRDRSRDNEREENYRDRRDRNRDDRDNDRNHDREDRAERIGMFRQPQSRSYRDSFKEKEPEWMDSEPLDSGKEFKQAHSMEEFQRWKAKMKAGAAAEEKKEQEEESPKEDEDRGDEFLKENGNGADTNQVDRFFGLWTAASSTVSLKSTEVASVTSSTAVNGKREPPPAPATGRSSRFTSFFNPTPSQEATPALPPMPTNEQIAKADASAEDKEGFKRILQMLDRASLGANPPGVPSGPPSANPLASLLGGQKSSSHTPPPGLGPPNGIAKQGPSPSPRNPPTQNPPAVAPQSVQSSHQNLQQQLLEQAQIQQQQHLQQQQQQIQQQREQQQRQQTQQAPSQPAQQSQPLQQQHGQTQVSSPPPRDANSEFFFRLMRGAEQNPHGPPPPPALLQTFAQNQMPPPPNASTTPPLFNKNKQQLPNIFDDPAISAFRQQQQQQQQQQPPPPQQAPRSQEHQINRGHGDHHRGLSQVLLDPQQQRSNWENRGPSTEPRPPPGIDQRGPPIDQRLIMEHRNFAERNGIPLDQHGNIMNMPPMEHRGSVNEQRGPPIDHRHIDQRGPPMDQRLPPMDQRSMMPQNEPRGPAPPPGWNGNQNPPPPPPPPPSGGGPPGIGNRNIPPPPGLFNRQGPNGVPPDVRPPGVNAGPPQPAPPPPPPGSAGANNNMPMPPPPFFGGAMGNVLPPFQPGMPPPPNLPNMPHNFPPFGLGGPPPPQGFPPFPMHHDGMMPGPGPGPMFPLSPDAMRNQQHGNPPGMFTGR